MLYFLQEKELIQRQEEFKRQLEIWKEEEKMRMNSKIDEVKQACQRDMDSMHQKNRNLEKVCFYFIYSTFSCSKLIISNNNIYNTICWISKFAGFKWTWL